MKINLQNKKIAILWYGKEGKSTLRFLQRQNISDTHISILDKNMDITVENFCWNLVVWEHYLDELSQYDYIFKTPWMSPYSPKLFPYKDKILTQAKIFFEKYEWKIISVTQTKWKSTTVSLIFELLKNAWFRVKLVGNIWNSVFDEVSFDEEPYDFIVFELSSYMLEDLQNHHSFISILWNIYVDHLDWHLNFENYSQAKCNILKNAEHILIGKEVSINIWKHLLGKKYFTFWENDAFFAHKGNDFYIDFFPIEQNIFPKLLWNHNLHNIAWVLWVANIIWIDEKIFAKTVNEFVWLPHRLQKIWEFQWITFIDDAISTTPESTIEAIKTFEWKVETIFLWWTDRGYDFSWLIRILEQYNVKNIVLFRESGKVIKKLLNSDQYNIFETDDMEASVEFAFTHTKAKKICLLSTASPSYSIWKDYEEKWNLFQKWVKEKGRGEK